MQVSKFRVRWTHSKPEDSRKPATLCEIIEVVEGKKLSEGDVKAQVLVRKSKEDPFDKEKARRASLTKALRQAFPFDKKLRGEFWEAYRVLPKNPRWVTRQKGTKIAEGLAM